MKKTYLLLIALFVSIVVMGGPITPDQARQKIAKFMQPRRAGAITQSPDALRLVATSHYKADDKTLAPSFYVFNINNEQGYVIAGADDRIPVVLGYSLSGSFDPQRIPENMKAWLRGYDRQMEYLNYHPDAAAPQNTVTGDVIAPLLDTRYSEGPIAWNQGAPYNDLCPMDSTARSLTGCVATAMAQIMYFWKYPAASTDVISGYTSSSRKFDVAEIPAKTPIDWENMLPKYKGNETETQKQAVANLMLMCGTALQMNYSKDFSGAWGGSVAIALRSYFDYDLATTFELHENYRAAVWNQRVYDELKAGRPVYYDGDSSDSGHAFVVDGYGGNDYFHVNWGWGGSSNDYFLLSILNPNNNSGAGATQSADGYSFGQGAIFGAQPNTGTSPTYSTVLSTNASAILDSTVYVRSSIDKKFVFKVGFTYFNHTNNTYQVDTGIGFYDLNGNLMDIIPGFWATLAPSYGFYDPTANPFTITMNPTTESGKFRILPMHQLRGTEDWKPTRNADFNYIKGSFKGDTLWLSKPVFDLTGTITATGKKEIASSVPITAQIINKGDDYLGTIFFVIDGKMVGGRHFDIKQNETTTIDFSFIPRNTGKVGVSVCTREWNNETQRYDYIPFVADSIDIEAASIANLTIEATAEGAIDNVVKTNAITLNTNIKNNGENAYNGDIKVELYKDAHNGGYYTFAKRKAQTIQLEGGATKNFAFTFDNLEDDNYLFIISYISEGNWESIKTGTYKVKTKDTGPAPTLQTTSKTANAIYEDNYYILKTDTAFISVKVENVGEVDYNDDIIVKLYKMTSSTGGPLVDTGRQTIQLTAGADTTVVIEFPGLEDGSTYFYWTRYIADESEVDGSKITPKFTVRLPEIDGIQSVKADKTNTPVYNMNGQRVVDSYKGVVIRNGRKTLRK